MINGALQVGSMSYHPSRLPHGHLRSVHTLLQVPVGLFFALSFGVALGSRTCPGWPLSSRVARYPALPSMAGIAPTINRFC